MQFENHVQAIIDPLIDSGVREFYLGVSGGNDSLLLLDIFKNLSDTGGLDLYALHFNYGLYPHADEAEHRIIEYCDSNRIELIGTSLIDPDLDHVERKGTEAHLRELRYDFFDHVLSRGARPCLVLGHHRDDQVETVLLNLGRGSGLHGLAGMSTKTETPAGHLLLRPLLEFSRDELVNENKRRQLQSISDPSNEDTDFARNRIRHEILPGWRTVQPDPDGAILRLSQLATRENRFWEWYIQQNFEYYSWGDEIQFDVGCYRNQLEAARLRFLHWLVNQLQGSPRGWSRSHFFQLDGFSLDAESGRKLTLPGSMEAVREYNRICVYRCQREKSDNLAQQELDWSTSGAISLNKAGNFGWWRQSVDKAGFQFCSDLNYASLTTCGLRNWQAGDRLTWKGRSRPLKEIFHQEKVPLRARSMWPVLVNSEAIVCLPGLVRNEKLPEQDTDVVVGFEPEHPSFSQLTNH